MFMYCNFVNGISIDEHAKVNDILGKGTFGIWVNIFGITTWCLFVVQLVVLFSEYVSVINPNHKV